MRSRPTEQTQTPLFMKMPYAPLKSPWMRTSNVMLLRLRLNLSCPCPRRGRERIDMTLCTALFSGRWESGSNTLLESILIMKSAKRATNRFSSWSAWGNFEIASWSSPRTNNLAFTLANLINPRLIQKNKASFCKEYSTLNTFLKDMATRTGSGKDVFVNFSFIKMEKTICTKEYDFLINFFKGSYDEGFTEDEEYALQQMLKVSSWHDLPGMSPCP